MNNSLPLLNVTTGAQGTSGSRAANPADNFSADVPFKQVLNSQVNNRNAENQSDDKPRAYDDQPQSPAPAQTQAANTSSTQAKPAEKKADDDKQAETEDDSDDTATQASAQLLALVANLQQNAVKPVSSGKGEDTDADLLAQAKRAGPKLTAQGEAQDLGTDARGKKIDFAALQSSVAANNAKKEATPDLAQQNAADALRSAKGDDKPAIALSTDTKATPKDELANLAARAQTSKVAGELNAVKQDLQQAAPAPVALPAMQQAIATSQPQAVFAAYTDKIQPNVGSAGWDQAVGQKLTWMVSGGIQSASLTLNPPDLGPMQVVLSVHNQQADATFITAQPEVKQALEQAMPKLREMMDQAGIQLGQATVNTGNPNQQHNAPSQQARSGGRGGLGGDDEGELAAVGGTTSVVTQSGLGLVDTFA